MRYILFLFLLISFQSNAQWKSYTLSKKGDTLNRVDVKGREQGPWVIRVEESHGQPGYVDEGVFENAKRTGVWKRFSLQGDLVALETYKWGEKDGQCVYLALSGKPVREESWRAVDPKNPYDTVPIFDVNDPTKITGTQIVKLEGTSVRHGSWKYYDERTGRLEKTETWIFDKLKKDGQSDDDELAPIQVTDNTEFTNVNGRPPRPPYVKQDKKKIAKPPAVQEFEKKGGKKGRKYVDGSTG